MGMRTWANWDRLGRGGKFDRLRTQSTKLPVEAAQESMLLRRAVLSL